MTLAWLCIFMVAAGVAMMFDLGEDRAPVVAPSPDAELRFT